MDYDKENTLYLKCPCCENVLVDVKIKENHLDPMTVIDYGIEYKYDDEWMWVRCQDLNGYERVYWKQR